LHLHRVQPSADGISACPLASDDLFGPIRPALGNGGARLGCFRRLYCRMGVGELGLHRVEAFPQSIDLGALASSAGRGSIGPRIRLAPVRIGCIGTLFGLFGPLFGPISPQISPFGARIRRGQQAG
jgi:hypothetical protein